MDTLILALVALGLWGGHWMRWSIFPGFTDANGELHRPLAYAYGMLCVLAGVVVWIAFQSGTDVYKWDVVLFLSLDIVAAGIGTMLPRVIRWIQDYQALKGDGRDYEQTIKGGKRDA